MPNSKANKNQIKGKAQTNNPSKQTVFQQKTKNCKWLKKIGYTFQH